jgi:FkbM family methyltransferase
MLKELKNYYHKKLARPFYTLIRPLQPILKFKKRTFFDKFQVKLPDGKKFWLYNNAFHWETEFFWQGFDKINWETKSREVWSELAKHSRTIFDIGSNTGIYSILAKTYNPSASVYAFEPQSNIYKVLQKNNQINDFDIRCLPVALSNEKGELPFYNTGDDTFSSINTTHGSLNQNWRTEKQSSVLVKVEKLEDFILENKIENIDLIKLDVETFEPQVLEGYGRFFEEHLPFILIEIQNETIGEDISDLIQGMPYDWYWINEKRGLVGTQTLGKYEVNGNWNFLLCPKAKSEIVAKFILSS